MVTDQLIAYIKQQTAQGVPPENIKAILRANGWDNTDINQAFKGIESPGLSNQTISPVYVNLPLKPNAKNKYEEKKIVRAHKSSWVFNFLAIIIAVSGTIFGLNIAFPNFTDPQFSTKGIQNLANENGEISEVKETYLKIRQEFDQTKNFAEFQALALKYGSKKQVAQIRANQQEMQTYPPEFLQNLFEKAKDGSPKYSEITSIEETTRENTSALKIFTSKNGIEGSVIMVLEDGMWKLEFESWSQ